MVAGLLGGFKATNYRHRQGFIFSSRTTRIEFRWSLCTVLFSTPFDWVKTINGLQADPEDPQALSILGLCVSDR